MLLSLPSSFSKSNEKIAFFPQVRRGGRDGGREGGRKGGREGGKEGGREGGRERKVKI